MSDIDKKITGHDHDKYITTSEFNKLITENFKARLAQADLIKKLTQTKQSVCFVEIEF